MLLNPDIQWVIFGVIVVAFITTEIFIVANESENRIATIFFEGPLVAFLARITWAYYYQYFTASASLDPIIIAGGIVTAKIFGLIIKRGDATSSYLLAVKCLLTFLTMFATLVALSPNKSNFAFQGVTRWSGYWEEPNSFGMLMAVGLLSSFGLLTVHWRKLINPGKNFCRLGCKTFHLPYWLKMISIPAASIIMGWALIKSFSRGAWIMVIFGTAAFLFCNELYYNNPIISYIRRSRTLLAAAFVGVLWTAVITEGHDLLSPGRTFGSHMSNRILSVVDFADSSWRNRLAAWKAAEHMMHDNFLLGLGWNNYIGEYAKYYLSPSLRSPGAIETNDALKVGVSFGVPALGLLVIYLGGRLALTPLVIGGGSRLINATSSVKIRQLRIAVRIIAASLLVGSFLNAVLWRFPLGWIFWLLVETG